MKQKISWNPRIASTIFLLQGKSNFVFSVFLNSSEWSKKFYFNTSTVSISIISSFVRENEYHIFSIWKFSWRKGQKFESKYFDQICFLQEIFNIRDM